MGHLSASAMVREQDPCQVQYPAGVTLETRASKRVNPLTIIFTYKAADAATAVDDRETGGSGRPAEERRRPRHEGTFA